MRNFKRHTCCAAYNACILVNGFQELPNNKRDALDAFYFFLRVQVFILQIPLLVLDVFLLDGKKLELPLEFLQNYKLDSEYLTGGLSLQFSVLLSKDFYLILL